MISNQTSLNQVSKTWDYCECSTAVMDSDLTVSNLLKAILMHSL